MLAGAVLGTGTGRGTPLGPGVAGAALPPSPLVPGIAGALPATEEPGRPKRASRKASWSGVKGDAIVRSNVR